MANLTISTSASSPATSSVARVPPAASTAPAVPVLAAAADAIQTPSMPKAVEPQLEQVQQAIDRVKQSIKPTLANNLEFQIDQSTGKTVVRITDMTTNTLVRQIPSEEMLIIAKALDDMQGRGGLVKGRA